MKRLVARLEVPLTNGEVVDTVPIPKFSTYGLQDRCGVL